jgi:hypothetical protein
VLSLAEACDGPDLPNDAVTFAPPAAYQRWWQMTLAGGPVVYDIVNRQSQIVDRVTVPDGATPIGFAPGGVVYLVRHDGGRATLLKARVR